MGDGDDAELPPETDVVLRLPDALRDALKQPMGSVYTDPTALLAEAGEPIVAVGDVVTHHLTDAGARPDTAVIDWHTEREAVVETVRPALETFDRRIEASNPAATLTVSLLDALVAGIRADDATVIVVEGEEDLAVLPALLVAPDGASVVYGQPGAGMVRVEVGTETRNRARDLLERMDGAHERAWATLGVEPS